MIERSYKLTPAVANRILDAVRAGNTREVCARRGGVSINTVKRWIDAGRAAKSGVLKQFAEDFEAAEADAAALNVACVQTAARPREIVTVSQRQQIVQKKVKTRYPDGRIVEETVPEVLTLETVSRTKDFDWRAAAWWLERRHHEHWRQRREVDVSALKEDQLVALLEASLEGGGGAARLDGDAEAEAAMGSPDADGD